MRLLVISGAFPPMSFPEAGHTLHLCQHLALRDVDVHLLTTHGAVTEGLPFNVHPIMRDWSWRDVPRFVRFMKQCSPDAVLMIYIGLIYNDHPMTTFGPSPSGEIDFSAAAFYAPIATRSREAADPVRGPNLSRSRLAHGHRRFWAPGLSVAGNGPADYLRRIKAGWSSYGLGIV